MALSSVDTLVRPARYFAELIDMTPTPLDTYKLLRGAFGRDIKGASNRDLLGDSFRASLDFLSTLSREPLTSAVAGKKYFAPARCCLARFRPSAGPHRSDGHLAIGKDTKHITRFARSLRSADVHLGRGQRDSVA